MTETNFVHAIIKPSDLGELSDEACLAIAVLAGRPETTQALVGRWFAAISACHASPAETMQASLMMLSNALRIVMEQAVEDGQGDAESSAAFQADLIRGIAELLPRLHEVCRESMAMLDREPEGLA